MQRSGTAFTIGSELAWHTNATGRIAPIGIFYTLGFGYTLASAGDLEFPASSNETLLTEEFAARFSEPESKVSATIGAGYRYVYKDQITLVPFLRFDVGAFGINGDVQPSVGLVWQTGIRVGGLF